MIIIFALRLRSFHWTCCNDFLCLMALQLIQCDKDQFSEVGQHTTGYLITAADCLRLSLNKIKQKPDCG